MQVDAAGIPIGEVIVAEALNDIAYRLITKKLTSSELVAGQKISEQQIATECGISRTPVREAVRRLTEEGVLYQIPSSGTYVARMDRRQLIDSYEVRMAIECFSLDHAIKNLTRETRQELRRLCDEMHAIVVNLRSNKRKMLDGPPLVAFLSADLSFHLLILKAAGNRMAIKIVNNAYQRNQFFGHHSHRRDLLHLSWAWMYHAKIERSIRRGDAEGARRWVRAHITRSMNDALAAFDLAAAAHADTVDPIDAALERLSSRFA
jgi:DNA-binding GntR family transcriptional regulator